MRIDAGQHRLCLLRQTHSVERREPRCIVFLALAGWIFLLPNHYPKHLVRGTQLNPCPRDQTELILENSVLECTCLIVYQLNWKEVRNAGSRSLLHSQVILEICKLHFLSWLCFSVLFCFPLADSC